MRIYAIQSNTQSFKVAKNVPSFRSAENVLQRPLKNPAIRQLEQMFKQALEREQSLYNVSEIFDDCCRAIDLNPSMYINVLNDVLNTVRKERISARREI